jgi:Tfp pilus assembly protein PilN
MKAPPLRLEFAPGARPRSRLGWAMLGCAIAVLVVQLVTLGFALSERERHLQGLALLDARQSDAARPRPLVAKPDPAYLAKVKSTQQVSKSLTAPWVDLLDAIESAPQQSVALLAAEPTTAKQSFRLTAEARDLDAMLGYLAALQKDRRLVSVFLVSHQVQVQTPGRPIRFQVQAGWGAPS